MPDKKHFRDDTRKLRKKWFMSLPDGYCALANTHPFEYVKLSQDRERDWKRFGPSHAGRLVYVFATKGDCVQAMAQAEVIRPASISQNQLSG